LSCTSLSKGKVFVKKEVAKSKMPYPHTFENEVRTFHENARNDKYDQFTPVKTTWAQFCYFCPAQVSQKVVFLKYTFIKTHTIGEL